MGVVLVGTKVLLGRGGGIPTRHSGQGLPNPLPNVSIASPSGVVEGTGDITFTVTLSVIGTEDVTVDYATSNGTALASTNYTAASGTLTIPAGQLTGTITVSVLNPSGYHGTKQFTLTLSNAYHGVDALTMTSASAIGTIVDDETNPAGGPHDYYEELIARGDLFLNESFRSRFLYNTEGGTPPAGQRTGTVTYAYDNTDTFALKQDAAKVSFAANSKGLSYKHKQPMALTAGSGQYLITWDVYHDESMQTERNIVNTYKAWQIYTSAIFFEIRYRLSSGALPTSIAPIDVRAYEEAYYGPGTTKGAGDAVQPQINAFAIAPNTWTRFWLLIDLKADGVSEYDEWSLWVADETRDAVQLFDRLKYNVIPYGIKKFWVEFDTSQSPRVGGEIVSYLRNWVVLHDPPDVSTLILTKPVGDS